MSALEKKIVIIEKEADEVMVAHSKEIFPNECCGFMYGFETENERLITLAKPVVNAKEGDQRRRFEISPMDYMKAEVFAIQKNISLLGVYHSHPQHDAIASETDLLSAQPYFSYVIYSIIDGEIAAVKSWQLNEEANAFEEETVKINEPSAVQQSL
jgi:proteasome lid subunit RPN8/RPN11